MALEGTQLVGPPESLRPWHHRVLNHRPNLGSQHPLEVVFSWLLLVPRIVVHVAILSLYVRTDLPMHCIYLVRCAQCHQTPPAVDLKQNSCQTEPPRIDTTIAS